MYQVLTSNSEEELDKMKHKKKHYKKMIKKHLQQRKVAHILWLIESSIMTIYWSKNDEKKHLIGRTSKVKCHVSSLLG